MFPSNLKFLRLSISSSRCRSCTESSSTWECRRSKAFRCVSVSSVFTGTKCVDVIEIILFSWRLNEWCDEGLCSDVNLGGTFWHPGSFQLIQSSTGVSNVSSGFWFGRSSFQTFAWTTCRGVQQSLTPIIRIHVDVASVSDVSSVCASCSCSTGSHCSACRPNTSRTWSTCATSLCGRSTSSRWCSCPVSSSSGPSRPQWPLSSSPWWWDGRRRLRARFIWINTWSL